MTFRAEVAPCSTCRFWDREQQQFTFGFCRRWPPRAGMWVTARPAGSYDRVEISIQTNSQPEWPNTRQDDGCGEHATRTGAAP